MGNKYVVYMCCKLVICNHGSNQQQELLLSLKNENLKLPTACFFIDSFEACQKCVLGRPTWGVAQTKSGPHQNVLSCKQHFCQRHKIYFKLGRWKLLLSQQNLFLLLFETR